MNDAPNNSQPASSLVEIEATALALRNDLAAAVITDQLTYEAAVEKRVAAKKWLTNADEFFDGGISDAHALHKRLLEQKKKVVGPVEAALQVTNGRLVTWDREQEQIRLAEERRLREIAEKEAEEQRIADAIHMESMGAAPEEVEAVLTQPVAVAAPIKAEPTFQKSSAVVMADSWAGVLTDLKALVKYIAKNPQFIGLVQINQPALNAQARALKESMNIPGIRAVNNRGVRGRG